MLVLSARDAAPDRVLGLDAGADDYLVKPFDLDELLARTRAQQRRLRGAAGQRDRARPPAARPGGADGHLRRPARRAAAARVHAAAEAAAERGAGAVSRAQLEESVYGWDGSVESNTVDVHIHKLRRKLYPEVIRTVRGVGYIADPAPPAPADERGRPPNVRAPREPRTARSIRTVLLAGTIAALLVVLGAAAWVSFSASEEEAQELFDARLATSARVLEALVARQVERATVASPIVITLPAPLEGADHDEANPLGHYYETKIAFQVWDRDAQAARALDVGAGCAVRAARGRIQHAGVRPAPVARVLAAAPARSGSRSPSATMRGASCRRSSRSRRSRRSSSASRCCSCSSAC